MPRPKRDRSGDLRRRLPRREPRSRILVVCEGGVTEAGYFRDLRAEVRNPLVEVEIDDRGGVPKTLVERAAIHKREAEREARTRRDDFLSYDEVWCVFDVDEHPHLSDARQQARDNGVRLAVSNPCFELWALLHFQEQTAYLERREARSRLKRHLKSYDKALPFPLVHPGYSRAVQRALELDRRREEATDPGGNPSTGVYRLTEQIRKGGRAAQISSPQEE
jgi:RloB-like protein